MIKKFESFDGDLSIKVKWDVSESSGEESFDLDDLGVTKEDWESMSDSDKEETIQSALDDLPERVSIIVDTWTED